MGNVINLRRSADRPDEPSASDLTAPLMKHLSQMAESGEVSEIFELLESIRKHQSHPAMLMAFCKNDSKLAREVMDESKDTLALLVEDYLSYNRLLGASEQDSTELHQVELEMHMRHHVLNTLKEYHEAALLIRAEIGEVTERESGISFKDLPSEAIQHARHSNKRINAAFSLMEGLGKTENAALSPTNLEIHQLGGQVESLVERYLEVLGKRDPKVQRGLSRIAQAKYGAMTKWEEDGHIIPEQCRELRAVLDSDSDVMTSLTTLWLSEDYGNTEVLERLVDKVTTDAQCYLLPQLSESHPPFVTVDFVPSAPPPEKREHRPTILAGPPPPSDSVPPSDSAEEEVLYSISDIPPEPLDFSTLKPESKPYVFKDTVHSINSGSITFIAFAMPGSTIEVPNGAKLDLFMAGDGITIKLAGPNAYLKIDKVTRTCKSLRVMGKDGVTFDNLELGKGVAEKLID